jgi:DNA-binding Lrp family transcriptional regulator
MATETEMRIENEQHQAKQMERARRENRDFKQVYPRGFWRIRELIETAPQAAQLYVWLAANVGAAGAVVASRELMAEELKVSTKTITRRLKELEQANAVVRIHITAGVYAYAISPEEVWNGINAAKNTAAFYTKTLARVSDCGKLKRHLKMMAMAERKAKGETVDMDQPDLFADLPEPNAEEVQMVAALLTGHHGIAAE